MNILVVCAAGMSSSALVLRLREYIKNEELKNIRVGSCSINEIDDYLWQADVLLVAPQISYLKNTVKKCRVIVISNQDYAMMDAKEIINKIHNNNSKVRKEGFVLNLAKKISANIVMKAINNSIIAIMPISVIGSFLIILNQQPFSFYKGFIEKIGIYKLVELGVDMTLGCISLYLSFFVAYYIGKEKKINGSGIGLISLMCFLMMAGKLQREYLDITYYGSRGIFYALLTGTISANISCIIMKKQKLYIGNVGLPFKITNSFLAIIPGLVNVGLSMIIIFIIRLTNYSSFPELLDKIIVESLAKFAGNNYISYLLFGFLGNLFWFIGIHGGNIVNSVTNPIYIPLAYENIQAVNLGMEIPYMLNNMTKYIYTFGGAGSTLSLTILMLLFSKSKKLKNIAKIAFPMGIFFINEPIIFGIPIIFNPILFIPFVFISPFCGLITVVAMKLNFINFAVGYQLPWTTPPIISGFIQGGITLALWQIMMIILSAILWYPFFKIIDYKEYMEESNRLPQ